MFGLVADLFQRILRHERGRLDIGIFSDYERRTEAEKKAQIDAEALLQQEAEANRSDADWLRRGKAEDQGRKKG